jgi:hypothetical protein
MSDLAISPRKHAHTDINRALVNQAITENQSTTPQRPMRVTRDRVHADVALLAGTATGTIVAPAARNAALAAS